MHRYRVLYPRPTQYQPTTRAEALEKKLEKGGNEVKKIPRRLFARIHDISEFHENAEAGIHDL